MPSAESVDGVEGVDGVESVQVVLVTTPLSEEEGGGVRASLHYLHADVVEAAGRRSHDATLSDLRPLLRIAEALRGEQRCLERRNAADVRATGRRRCMNTVLNPLLYHDACTLYAGLVNGDAWVSPRGWSRCTGCGNREWGITCTPPRIAGGRLVRDFTDGCVAFCWTCTARRSLPAVAR